MNAIVSALQTQGAALVAHVAALQASVSANTAAIVAAKARLDEVIGSGSIPPDDLAALQAVSADLGTLTGTVDAIKSEIDTADATIANVAPAT